MRRTLVLVVAATSLALVVAGPAAAGPPRDTGDLNCRPGTMCHYDRTGWADPPGRRNVGG